MRRQLVVVSAAFASRLSDAREEGTGNRQSVSALLLSFTQMSEESFFAFVGRHQVAEKGPV